MFQKTIKDFERIENLFAQAVNNAIESGRGTGEGERYSSKNSKKKVDRNKRSSYNEFNTIGMQWAYGSAEVGDRKILFDGKTGENKLIVCTKEDIGFIVVSSNNNNFDERCTEWKNAYTVTERVDKKTQNDMRGHGNRSGNINIHGNAGNGKGIGGLSERKSSTEGTDSSSKSRGNLEEIRETDRGRRINNEADSIEPAFSMPEKDSKGNELTKEQQDYFKDSKVRDEDGNLKVMYHGSLNEFTVFDKKKARASDLNGWGFYFTDSQAHAGTYGNMKKYYL